MKWNDTLAGIIAGAQQRLWVALGDNADQIATRINSDESFVTNIARFMQNGGVEPTTSQKHAREIMGRNMFGIEEVQKHFGVTPTKQQLAFLAEVPFSDEVLTACKATHVLVAGFPLNLIDVRAKATKHFYTKKDAWYEGQAFADEKIELGWYLICKVPVEKSFSKNWKEQQSVLRSKHPDEETPKANILAYTVIGHFLATGERLFEKVWVRTSSLDSDGGRVVLGYFGDGGLGVSDYWDDDRGGRLGLSSARKQ